MMYINNFYIIYSGLQIVNQMALRILLTACCERVEDNLKKYNLKYDYKNGRIHTDIEKFVPCISCGKNLLGVAVLECVINRRGFVQELGAAVRDEIGMGHGIVLDCAPEYNNDLTGMTE
jgi:hypothetical protein